MGESGSRVGEHWEFDGTAWQQLPSRSLGTAMAVAYDSTRNRILAVGGTTSTRSLRTFAFSGTWSDLTPATAPTPRARELELVYDAARDRAVLYICGDSSPLVAETWEFDGTDWSLRTRGGPTPRLRVEMAYDPVRARTVMFGGWRDGPRALAETWEWDGVSWVERLVPAPNERVDHAMAWDDAIGAVVVYGGGPGTSGRWIDTWAWDGASWTELATSADPGPRFDAGMTYDVARGGMILAGGAGTSATGTWELTAQAPVRGTYAPFGTGCAGSAGVPILVNFQGDLPYINETFSLRIHNVGTSLLNLPFGVIGFSNTNWRQFLLPVSLAPFGFSGCSGFVSLDEVTPLAGANPNGTATWDIAIPNDPTLSGGAFYVQALVLDPGSTPGGAIVSNAGAGIVGLR